MILTNLRGDTKASGEKEQVGPIFSPDGSSLGDWKAAASSRFPEEFCQSVPESAQVRILLFQSLYQLLAILSVSFLSAFDFMVP